MRILTSLLLCILLAGCVFEGRTMRFKFPSSGQSVDDALVVTQTLLGNSLQSLAPVNIKMYRSMEYDVLNAANDVGNIGFEWTRRSRIAPGLRPHSDVPFGEELVRYEVEIMDGADVVRTIFVDSDDFSPVLWHKHSPNFNGIYALEDESVFGEPSGTTFGVVVSKQRFNVGSDDIQISFTVNTTAVATAEHLIAPYDVGLMPVVPGSLGAVEAVIGFHRNLGATVTRTTGLTTNVNLVPNLNARLMLKVNRSGQASLHQDSDGQLSAPLGGQTVMLIPGWYWLTVKNGTTGTQNVCALLRPQQRRRDTPDCVYLLSDALADFGGSLPSTLTIRVYQISTIVGRGPYTEATFTL